MPVDPTQTPQAVMDPDNSAIQMPSAADGVSFSNGAEQQMKSAPVQAAQPQAAAAPAAPAGVPPVTATSKNPAMHSFISRVLGAFAGDPPPVYSTTPDGKLIASAPPDSSGRKIGRIVQHALIGLSAPTPPGRPSILAGMGAGFGAVSKEMTEQNAAAKEDARKDFEEQQQTKLRQFEIAKANAQNFQLHTANLHQQNDLDPVRAQNKEIADAFRTMPEHGVREMSAEAAKAAVLDPNNQTWAHTHLILPAGFEDVTDSNGKPLQDAEGNYRTEGRVFVIDGMKDGKVPIPASIASDVQKYRNYGDLAKLSGLDGIREGDEYDAQHFVKLYNALLSSKVEVEKGWSNPEVSEDKDGKIVQRNAVNNETKAAIPTQVQKFQMDKANLAEKQQQVKTGKSTEIKNVAEAGKADADAAKAKKEAENEATLNPPASSGLTGDEYLKTLPSNTQGVLKAIAEGRETRSPRQLQDKNGNPTPLAEALHRAYPDFDDKKAAAYGAVVKDFTSGPTSRALTSYGTAINHARALYDNSNMKSYIPGTDENKRYNQDITYVATEVAKALNPTGVATEGAIKEQEEALRSYTNRKAAIENAEHILTGKMAETKQRWANAQVRPSYQPPMPGLSPEAIANADYVRNHGKVSQPGPQSGQQNAAPKQNPFRNSQQPGQ